jgi:hypothetical protein
VLPFVDVDFVYRLISEQSFLRAARPLSFLLLLDLIFDPEDGGSKFLRNVGKILLDYIPIIVLDKFGLEQYLVTYVGFEVLKAVVIHSTIFWDITPCSLLNFFFYPEDGDDIFLRNVG